MKLKYKSSIEKDSRPGPVSGHSDTIGLKYSTKKIVFQLEFTALIDANLD
jgi:hypothetical protein